MSTEHRNLDYQYMSMLQDVTFQPIFVMGDLRTGTTILYKILGATECFNIVTAYHLIYYDEIVHNYVNQTVGDRKAQLVTLFEQRGLRDRGFDRVQVSPDTPEDYGPALRNIGPRQQLKPDNLDSFIELCKKVQLTSDPARPLLLKNPWDFLNFMYVKQVLPESKFIFIHRNPIRTINSQLKAARSVLGTRNEYVALIVDWYAQLFRQPLSLQMARFLFSSHFGLGLKVVMRHVGRATTYFLKNVSLLPPEDHISVRYEDLCREPKRTVTEILDWLDIQERTDVEYDSFIAVRATPLLPEVQRGQAVIFSRLKPYFDYWGYELTDAVF